MLFLFQVQTKLLKVYVALLALFRVLNPYSDYGYKTMDGHGKKNRTGNSTLCLPGKTTVDSDIKLR